MKIQSSLDKGPEIEFCCEGAKSAWAADALVIVPKPHGDDEPVVFTAAIDYEGGSALMINFCPFCGTAVTPSEPWVKPENE